MRLQRTERLARVEKRVQALAATLRAEAARGSLRSVMLKRQELGQAEATRLHTLLNTSEALRALQAHSKATGVRQSYASAEVAQEARRLISTRKSLPASAAVSVHSSRKI